MVPQIPDIIKYSEYMHILVPGTVSRSTSEDQEEKIAMATSVSSGGALLHPEEESEAEVRREDQENINKFARLNARLHEVRGDLSVLKVSFSTF